MNYNFFILQFFQIPFLKLKFRIAIFSNIDCPNYLYVIEEDFASSDIHLSIINIKSNHLSYIINKILNNIEVEESNTIISFETNSFINCFYLNSYTKLIIIIFYLILIYF